MAATGILAEAVTATKTALTALGLKPVTDPRNARPLSVMIELPTLDAFTYNVGDIRLVIRVLAGPPGNQDSGDYLMTTVDTIMNSPIAIVDGRPSLASYGEQMLPCYDMTVAVAVRRNSKKEPPMATTTFLSNATISITQGATTTDLSDQANQVTLTIGQDSLESTAFGDTGHRFTGGLQSVEVSATLFLSYGATEVEAILASCVGTGTTILTISPSGATESASNPEYVISNLMISSFTPINSTVGELATVEISGTGGTWVRDITV